VGKGKKIGVGIGITFAVLITITIAVGAIYLQTEVQTEVEQRKALQNVEISFDGVGNVDPGLTSARLDLVLRMYNPNDITATLDRADFDLWGNENYLGNGVINKRVDIPPFASRTVHTDFELDYGGIGSLIWSTLTASNMTWRIAGTAYYDTPLGTIDIPFDLTQR